MKKIVCILVFVLMANSIVHGDYTWITNPANGHQYALTLNVGTWEQAEAEAQALNPSYHLVTINDEPENAWVTSKLGPPFTEPLSTYEWIGFYQDHADPLYSEPAGGWKWISGEAVTFTGWNVGHPNNQGQEDYGVLQSEGVWNDWGPGATEGYWDIYGIIETPEPTSLLLLGLGGLVLRRRKA